LLDFRTFRKCGNVIWGLNLFCRLKTSENPQKTYNYYPNKYRLKMLGLQFLQHKLHQTNLRSYFKYFAMKWLTRDRTFEKRCFILAVLWWNIYGFSMSGLEHQNPNLQLAIRCGGFAICGLANLRNLWICESKIFGFAICVLKNKFASPPLLIRECSVAISRVTYFGCITLPPCQYSTGPQTMNSNQTKQRGKSKIIKNQKTGKE
jgi:hypothetical protein